MLPDKQGLDFFLNLHIDFFKSEDAKLIRRLTIKSMHEKHFGKGYIKIYLEYKPLEEMSGIEGNLLLWTRDYDDRNYMSYHVSSGYNPGKYGTYRPYADSQVAVYALKMYWKEQLIDETKFINICHHCYYPFTAPKDYFNPSIYCDRCSERKAKMIS